MCSAVLYVVLGNGEDSSTLIFEMSRYTRLFRLFRLVDVKKYSRQTHRDSPRSDVSIMYLYIYTCICMYVYVYMNFCVYG